MIRHVMPALKQLDWKTIRQILRLRDAAVAFKCPKGLAPSYLNDRFIIISDIHHCNTRNKNLFDISKVLFICRLAQFLV